MKSKKQLESDRREYRQMEKDYTARFTLVLMVALVLLMAVMYVTETAASEVEFETGTVGDESINLTTIKVGDHEFTNGNVGDRPVYLHKQRIGDHEFTTGSVDGEPVQIYRWSTEEDESDPE